MDLKLSRSLPTPAAFGPVLREALKCLVLSFKDSLKPKVVFHLLAIWLVSLAFWGLLFYWQWDKILHAAQAVAAYVGLVAFISLASYSWLTSTAGVVEGIKTGFWVGYGGIVLMYALVALPFVLLVLLSVRVLLEVFLMKHVQKQTLTRYPQIEKGAPSKWLDGLRLSSGNNVKALLVAFFSLFIPFVNGVVLLFVGCYFSAKFLVGEALEDLATAQEVKQFTGENRLGILVLGLLQFGVFLIPFVGLLAPAIMGSSTCHFCFRAKARQLAQRAE